MADSNLREQQAHSQAAQFTPGPWRACEGNYKKRDGLTLCKCGQIFSRATDKHVATAHRLSMAEDMFEEEAFVQSDHEAEANAHLIASAPDLLDALADCYDALMYLVESYDFKDDVPTAETDRAEKLLSRLLTDDMRKARGQQ